MPAVAETSTKPTPINFADLLAALGFAPDDLVAISSKRGGIFKGEAVIPAAEAADYPFTPDGDWYFGINPVRAGLVPPKRGTADDVTRVRDLIGDFDIKDTPGFCPSKDVARALIAEIGLKAGAQPVAIVDSGAGLHAHWALVDGDHPDTPALVKLWRSAVETIAAGRGIKVDNCFDISRVLRVPNTWNFKYGDPIDVTGYRGPSDAKPLTVAKTIKTLAAAGITAAAPDPVGPPADAAPEPQRTCDYVTTMTAGWASDTPNAGGHQWLIGQTVRLAAAMRAGCITRVDAAAALDTLRARQVSTTGKEPTAADWKRIVNTANAKAAAMTAEKLAQELGDHHAVDDLDDLFGTTPEPPKATAATDTKTGTADVGDDGGTLRTVPWPTLAPAALTGTAGEILRPVLAHTEADTAALLVTTLALFGATVHTPHVLVANQEHRANLHTLIVGSTSGGAKGTGWGAAKALLLEAMPTFAINFDSGLNSGEGLIERVRDESEDATGKVIPGVDDKRLVILEEEYRTVLTRGKREGNSLSMVLRLAWDGAVLRSMTRKNNALTATGAHIIVVGHVTPREFIAALADSDLAGGSVNRLLITLSRRRRLRSVGLGNVPPEVLNEAAKILRGSISHAARRGRVSLSRAAAARWETEYHRLTADRPDSRATDATARAASQVIRLALIYTLIDKAQEIGLQQLEAALALWDYCDRSARWLFSSHAAEAAHSESTKLLDYITTAGPTGRTRTEIYRDFYRGNKKAAEIDRLLEPLVRSGAVIEEVLPRNTAAGEGRPVTVYVASSERINGFNVSAGQGAEVDASAYVFNASSDAPQYVESVTLRTEKTAPELRSE